jgi:hypothetical protein
MAVCAELNCIESALQALSHAADSASLRAALRRAERAADDAECAADEAREPELRAQLRDAARAAHQAATHARTAARGAARDAADRGRLDLLEGDGTRERSAPPEAAGAARLAEDIRSSLRRSTAVLHEELARTNAAGDVRFIIPAKAHARNSPLSQEEIIALCSPEMLSQPPSFILCPSSIQSPSCCFECRCSHHLVFFLLFYLLPSS